MNWKISFGKARGLAARSLLAAVLAAGVSVTAGAERAQAKNWVGPAIIGAVVGAAIIHHAHRNHQRQYAYGYPVPARKVYRRHPQAYYHQHPAFVPMIGFGFYGPFHRHW